MACLACTGPCRMPAVGAPSPCFTRFFLPIPFEDRVLVIDCPLILTGQIAKSKGSHQIIVN
jgi:hypothetical protein